MNTAQAVFHKFFGSTVESCFSCGVEVILGWCSFPGHYFFHDHDDYDIKVHV